ncbi:MAG: beta-ketoacyl-ACP synthase II [Eubacteriales bacterium]
MRRVVITGIGVISPVGNSTEAFWDSLVNGRSGIGEITHFDTTDYKIKLAAEVKNFNPLDYYEKPTEGKRADPFTHFAVAAATEAITDSGLLESNPDRTRIGVYVGSGIGGMQTFVNNTLTLDKRGPGRVSPLFVPMMISNMAAGAISIRYGLKGPTLPTVTACATSAHEVGEAFHAIKGGYADAILAGGAESAIEPLSIAGFMNCKALSESTDPDRASIPFDAERNGFVMGEGSAILVLEELEHAKARGAKIYAEIVGYGNTADAYHMTSPDPEATGSANCIRIAAEEAGITGDEEIYVNAHGTSTHLNDMTETRAYKAVFGDKAYKMHFDSTKSMTGHMLGATGAVEAAVCALALRDGIVPPTINYKVPDPECDLNYTPGTAVKADLKYALSTNLGFGGHNACLAFKKYEV